MKTRTRTSQIFIDKLYERSLKIKRLNTELQTLAFHEDIRMVTDITNGTSDQCAIVAADCTVILEMKIILDKLKTIMRASSPTNNDMSLMINGASDEHVCMYPSSLPNQKY